VTGSSDEALYWDSLRKATGIRGSDKEYRREILDRFTLRQPMIKIVKSLGPRGLITAILSDQTNWLDEINRRSPFFHHFDFVFNSYVLKKSKRDRSVFKEVCSIIGVTPREALFVDDNEDNIKNAHAVGMRTILFRKTEEFAKTLADKLRRTAG
jgi:putative hydrolase of the HAD superfamily